MGWKDVAKLASGWAEAKKDELLSDERKQDLGATLLEKVLPPELAEKVTAARPENVAARRAEDEARAETERRDHLATLSAGGETAELELVVDGGEHGTLTVTLPCVREEEAPDDGSTAWFRVRLESPDPVLLGSTSLAVLSLAVPAYAGPGRYDLSELYRRGESGEIETWEAFDLCLSPVTEVDDRTWYADLAAPSPAVIDVAERSVAFDLPMGSAVSSIRAVGTVRW